ncbi:peptide deformylase [Gaertneriomyces semiglobifer]|nr:peptide deformylase [Gaertneriomyces semiglobifer]
MVLNKLQGLFQKAPKVLRAGHPGLRHKADAVKISEITSPKIQRVVTEMRQVFSSPLTPLVGLAAPQIGHPLRIMAYQVTDKQLLKEKAMSPVPLTFLVNPELSILDQSPASSTVDYESCESIPHYNGLVSRADAVRVLAYDLEGNPITVNARGFLARVLQHEVDHLDGILYIDRMDTKSFRHDMYIDKYETYRRR